MKNRKLFCISLVTVCLFIILKTFHLNADTCGILSYGHVIQAKNSHDLIKTDEHVTTGPPLREPDMNWVNDTLSSMTLEEKVGQMLMPSTSAGTNAITNYHVGGFIFVGNNQQASNIISVTNQFQTISPHPLFFAIDAEAGMGARVANATIFPLIMAFGAANDAALTEDCGGITARECRSLGVQIAFGPVVDVNTEPENPIISTRSYGDDPKLVTRMARGFIHGARREGLLCTFKHYPGHGDTIGDSHSSLPVVGASLETLREKHIFPYGQLAGTGDIDLVMTAHVWYSAVNPDNPWPATLSSFFLNEILRTEIGYDGLIISDAYGMAGLAVAVPDEKERAAVGVEAGLDIILMPPDLDKAYHGIIEAVQDERISEERIDQSVRRILTAKSRAGLPESKLVDPALHPQVLRHPEHLAKVREVCEKSFTLVRNDLGTSPPVSTSEKALVLSLDSSRTIFYRMSSDFFTNPFMSYVPAASLRTVSKRVSASEKLDIIEEALENDKVIVLGYDWYKIMSDDHVDLINQLSDTDIPVIYVSFGAPYHYTQIPEVDAFYCGYASVDAMQETAVEVLLGFREPVGDIPVNIPGLVLPKDALLFY